MERIYIFKPVALHAGFAETRGICLLCVSLFQIKQSKLPLKNDFWKIPASSKESFWLIDRRACRYAMAEDYWLIAAENYASKLIGLSAVGEASN